MSSLATLIAWALLGRLTAKMFYRCAKMQHLKTHTAEIEKLVARYKMYRRQGFLARGSVCAPLKQEIKNARLTNNGYDKVSKHAQKDNKKGT